MSITFVTSQRGAKFRTTIRQVLKRVQDEAEIIPNEPGQVMLLRDRALKKVSLIFLARGWPVRWSASLCITRSLTRQKINL
jgi:hypothetical protein